MISFTSIKKIALIVWLLTAVAAMSYGQAVTGTILGRVTDASGAAVAGAMVQIQNPETGFSATLQTDTEGRYLARNLAPGSYDLTITQSGFQSQVRHGIVLSVAGEIAVNAELTIGNVQEKVEVTATAAAIETTNAAISNLVSQDQMRDLPLNGRSLDQLALLTPGVFVSRYTQNVSTLGRGLRISVNGGRQDANVYLIDGTVVNDHAANGPNSAGGNALGVEGILEYRVLTHNFSAEYGRNSGAVVSMVTRAGTNTLHGSAYEFLRNSFFDARNFFNQDPATHGALPPFRRNQFGGAAGGAVKKDKIFFFLNYEALRQNQGKPFIATVPDLNARKGLVPCAVIPAGVCTAGLTQAPFNTASAPYLNMYPLPTGRVFGDGTALSSATINVPTNEDYGMARMDFRLSDKDNFYWRYMVDTGTSVFPRPGNITADFEGGGYHFVTLSESHIFSSKALNEIRIAMNRNDPVVTSAGIDPRVDFASLGFVAGYGFGGITYSTGNQGGGGGSGASQQLSGVEIRAPDRHFVQNIFEENDAFSLIEGPHALKFGVDFERIQLNFPSGVAGGTYQFNTGLLGLIAGTPTRFTFTPPTFETAWRRNLFAWFVQDDYRVNSRLTLNVGLRHEFFTTPNEIGGRSGNVIHPTDQSITVGAPFTSTKKTFSPRFGMAWDPFGDGKTSVRLGAGIFYNYFDGRTWYMGAGVTSASQFSGSITASNPPWPHIDPNQFAAAAKSVYSIGSNGSLKEPTVIHYNLEVQRQLTQTVSMRVGYIGSKGYHMGRLVAENVRIPTVQSDGSLFFPLTGPVVNSKFADISGLYTDAHYLYNGLQTVVQKATSYGLTITGNYTWSKAMSDSDEVGPAQSNGVAPTTYDRTNLRRDWSLSTFDQRQTIVINGRYQMPWDKSLKSGMQKAFLGGWAINGIFSGSSGQPFNINTGFNNSQNNDSQQTDRPNLTTGFNNNPISGVTAGCTNSNGTVAVAPGQKLGTPDLWFDPCAFSLQKPGTFGNLGRNTVIAPGFREANVTLQKITTIREGKTLEFRAEFFNVLNHTNFTLPARTVFTAGGGRTGAAGVITTTQGNNRQIQLGLKLNF